jgi:hypothetical protein
MDVALWMSPDVLRHKLAARDERNPEAAWNVSRLPAGLGRPGAVDRLFVASAGAWRGWCALAPDALYCADDPRAPITILFDTRTWTATPPLPVARFRGLRALTAEEARALAAAPP